MKSSFLKSKANFVTYFRFINEFRHDFRKIVFNQGQMNLNLSNDLEKKPIETAFYDAYIQNLLWANFVSSFCKLRSSRNTSQYRYKYKYKYNISTYKYN
jgi:hypothetical protein